MKKKLFIYSFLFIVILIGGLVVYNNFFATKNPGTKNEIKKDQYSKEFTFETAEGTIKIDATQALTLRGFAGSSNKIFYLKDNNLYYYVNNGEDELYAENVESIYYESDQSEEIVVKLNTNAIIVKESPYLIYLKEGEQIYNFETAYVPSNVRIVATKAMAASGSAGSSNKIFYIKDNNLYYYVHEGEDELLAEKVLDITFDIKQCEELIIRIDNNSKIINTNPYILYMKEGEQIYNFETAYVPSNVRIVATKAMAASGSAGSSNKIFYLKDNNLYYYVHEGEDELLAEKVLDITFDIKQCEELIIKIDNNSKIINTNPYILYMKEGEQIYNFETAYGTVKIVATAALTPRGFAGSSNKIFYLKDNNLYYYVHEGEDELYAENVDSIYYESKQSEEVIAKLKGNSKIVKESPYVIYKN